MARFLQALSLVSALALLLGSISACAVRPTPTAAPMISREKAIEIATGGCKIPDLVLVGEPENIRTKLLTLQEADQQTLTYPTYGEQPDLLVWMVEMDGYLQLVGGPAPTPGGNGQKISPTPFWGTCTAVLDANTGKLIFIRG